MQNPPSATDSDLIARARAGDAPAFEVLVRRHTPRVYAVAMRMMRNPIDAQDIVQETFMNAFRRLDSFRGEAAFGSWLHRIASNCCLMRMRSRRRRPEVPLSAFTSPNGEDGWERPTPDTGPPIDVEYEHRELGSVIRSAMRRLPEHYRDVFVRADLQDMTMKQVADDLDLTVPNVKTRLHRARLKLRAEIQTYLDAKPCLAA